MLLMILLLFYKMEKYNISRNYQYLAVLLQRITLLENDRERVFMVIEVRLHEELGRYAPYGNTGILVVDVPEDITVQVLLEELEIEQNEIYMIKVNGIRNNKEYQLADGDHVEFYPALTA
jgi:molybdopterin converting factor small subunit